MFVRLSYIFTFAAGSDAGCHFFIQQGVSLSRSNVLLFEHNNCDDLESVLRSVAEQDHKRPQKLNRRFIVTEGLSQVQYLQHYITSHHIDVM